MVEKALIRFFCWLVLFAFTGTVHAQTWKELDAKTTAFYKAGNIDSAIFYANKELIQAEKEFGKIDSNYASSLNVSANLYKKKGDYKKAESMFLDAVTIRKKVLGEENPDYAATLNDLGELYENMGKYDKAEPLYTESLSIRKKIFGEETPPYATTLTDLALLYLDMGIYPKAEPLFAEALAIRKKKLGEDDPDYATSLENMAGCYQDMGIYAKSEPLFIQALAIRKKILGPEHLDYAASLDDLGELYLEMGIYAKAEPLLVEALAIRKRILGPEHPDYATSLNNLGMLYKDMGIYGKSEPLLTEALTIRKKILGENHPYYAASLNNLALLYLNTEMYAKAEPLLIEAKTTYKKIFGPENPEYATCLENLAYLYNTIGNYSKAEPLLIEALAIRKKTLGVDHLLYGESLNNLAILYTNMGVYAKAIPLLTEALAIYKKALGTESPEYATSLDNLADSYKAVKDYTKAEPLYLEALEIQKKILGTEHPDYSISLNNLAELYETIGEYTKAESLYTESLAINKKILGESNPAYVTSLDNLAYLYQDTRDYKKAEQLVVQAKKNLFQNISKNFAFLSEAEKEKYIATVSNNLESYQSFFRNYQQIKPSVAAESYDIELVTKGMILSSDIQLRQTIQAGGNKDAIDLFNRWTSLKNTLAKLYSIPIGKRQLNIDSIENLANDDEKQLTRLSASFRQGKLLTHANWRSVQQALKPNDVAIEFASFHYHNGKRWTDTVLYTALVLRKGDAYPAMVNLCRQDQLDNLLNKAGNTQGTFIGNLYRGATITSTHTSVATRQKLYKLIWKPIEKLLHPGDHIYYAPSGLLHQVAFAAIPREDGKLLSDRYQLTQLSSTAMLLQAAPAVDTKNLSIAAYGGIQYDASEKELASLASKDTQRFVSRSLLPDSARGGTSFVYLPGTLTEINSIAFLGKRYHVPVTLYTGINATEEAYKRNGTGPSPGIIHIATHGFFFPDPKKAKPGNAMLSGEKQPFTLSDNPLNRAGLAFAGANHAWKGEAIPPGQEDGILTAYEASNVPLSSTQLVVLSACETGLGDIKGSEGVFGLQRAFKAAGATYIMMSLWQVPDKETAEFMKYFYRDLFSGQSIAKAFTSAQTTMKNKYRGDPYKWAAFVLMR